MIRHPDIHQTQVADQAFPRFQLLLGVVILAALAGCGGFRGGYLSAPYLGDGPPDIPIPETRYEFSRVQSIEFPDLKLDLALNNALQTYDFQVFLFIVPGYVNLKERRREAGDALQVSLHATPSRVGFAFDPRHVVMTIDGQAYRPKVVWLDDGVKRRQAWYDFAQQSRFGAARPPVPTSEQWRTSVDAPMDLSRPHTTYEFTLLFDAPVPAPDQVMTLDLSTALETPARSPVPLIRFRKLRWKEGYS